VLRTNECGWDANSDITYGALCSQLVTERRMHPGIAETKSNKSLVVGMHADTNYYWYRKGVMRGLMHES